MKKIPLRISGGEGIAYSSWPITQGIPFADGELERGTPVRVVDGNGNTYSTQSSCLVAWDKNRQYVRWLLIDFQADFESGENESSFFLEYGNEAQAPEPEPGIRIDQEDNHLLVDTGVLKLEIRNSFKPWQQPNNVDFFGRCMVKGEDGWNDIFRGDPGPFLYMKDQYGNEYDSWSGSPAPRVSVEEDGPLRSSICIKGYHAMKRGPRFCPYILRLHFFAGKSDIRVFHTFIYDQEPHRVELSAIGMHLPLKLGEPLRAALGGTERSHWVNNWGTLSFLQSSDTDYEVALDGGRFADGSRTSGWAGLAGSSGSAVAVIRDIWKEYPKGFVIDNSGIDIQIWPEEIKKNLSFTTPYEEPAVYFNATRDEREFKRLLEENPTAPLNLKSLNIQSQKEMLWVEEMIEKYGSERAATYNDTGVSNGTGAAKTTEICLRFSSAGIADAEAEEFARAVQEPLLTPADPAYSCATGAFGHFYHAGDPRFKDVDDGLDFLLESVAVEPMERCRLYGMMRYGNMVCSHAPGPSIAYLHHKDTEPEKALRYVGPYNNEANDQIMSVWGNFLRTGRREHLLLAQAYSRNVADVGIIHTNPADPDGVGLMHYHNCHHWSGEGSPSHTLLSGILTDYCVTGNRRLLEVAREVADWAVRNQEDSGIISCRNGVLHREFTGPLWSLLEVYRITWEEKYWDVARKSINWFLRTIKEPGTYPVSVYTRGERGDEAVVEPYDGPLGHARDVYHLYLSVLRLADSEKLREHIIAEADYHLWDALTDNFLTAEMAKESLTERSLVWKIDDEFYWTQWGTHGGFAIPILALAFDLTGDYKYAAFCKDHLEGYFKRQVKRSRQYAHWGFSYLWFGSYVPRLMRVVADAMDKDQKALDRAEKEWKEGRAELGRPVYTGPGVDLGKDTMDSNGNIVSRSPCDIPRQALPRQYDPKTNLGRLSTDDL